MTKEWYQSAGYKLGLNNDQNGIDRAERDVMEAYIRPILPTADADTDDYIAHTLADLAFLLMAKRSTFLTRSGAKEKTGANSVSVNAWTPLEELAKVCKMRLEHLRSMSGAVKDAKVKDICKIYFTTNFIHG